MWLWVNSLEDIQQECRQKWGIYCFPYVLDYCFVFDDFKNNDNNWRMVNDGVMGGISKGSYTINNDVLTVRGNINTNGGGFS